jgi:hypothetical protein
MKVRLYKLVDTHYRFTVSLNDYAECIIQAYEFFCADDVKVVVHKDYYEVYGNPTDGQLRAVGSRIARHSALGEFCKRYGKSTQLFRCTKEYESNIYYKGEEDTAK